MDLLPLTGSLPLMSPDYLAQARIIDEALTRVNGKKAEPSMLPGYYDDALRRLIDLVPLDTGGSHAV